MPSDIPSSISSTLLERIKEHRPEAWQRLVDLYGPVVYRWCRQSGVGPEDAADLTQEVFRAVATHVSSFRRRTEGDSFGAWLGTITRNKMRDHFRRRHHLGEARGGTHAQQQLQQIPEPADFCEEGSRLDHDGMLSRRALQLVRDEFENRTWEAFHQTAVAGRKPVDVADELGMSLQAVYKAKSRVLQRLRQEFGDLLGR